jgi:hypothetical protein
MCTLLIQSLKCDDHQLERGFLLGFCTHAAWICIAVQCDLIDLNLSWLVGYLENNKYNESVNGKDLAALQILNFQFSASGNKFYAGIIKQKKLFLDGSSKEFKGRLCVQKFKEHCKPSSWSSSDVFSLLFAICTVCSRRTLILSDKGIALPCSKQRG